MNSFGFRECFKTPRQLFKKERSRNTFPAFFSLPPPRTRSLIITLRHLFRNESAEANETSDYTLAITPAISFFNSGAFSLRAQNIEVITSNRSLHTSPEKKREKRAQHKNIKRVECWKLIKYNLWLIIYHLSIERRTGCLAKIITWIYLCIETGKWSAWLSKSIPCVFRG